ncbi:hypothetical protein LINPERPRIM_LOCUS16313 [Linum perenne]
MLSFLRGSYLNISPMNLRCCYSPRSFSTALPPVHLPSRMETHLWYVVPNEVKSASLLSQYMELLPQSERDHVLSFRGDQLQKSALLARTLVRTTIARYQVDGHLDPRSLRFKRNIHGKPENRWSGRVKMTGTHHHCISTSHTLLL